MPGIQADRVSLILLKNEHLFIFIGLDERDVDELTCLQQRYTALLYDRENGIWSIRSIHPIYARESIARIV